MKILWAAVKKVFLWDYERGSWQYDLLCGLILAFIFFGPNQVFHSADGDNSALVFVSREEVGTLAAENYEQELSNHFSKKYNRKVRATNIEPLSDSEGNLKGYLVKEIKQ